MGKSSFPSRGKLFNTWPAVCPICPALGNRHEFRDCMPLHPETAKTSAQSSPAQTRDRIGIRFMNRNVAFALPVSFGKGSSIRRPQLSPQGGFYGVFCSWPRQTASGMVFRAYHPAGDICFWPLSPANTGPSSRQSPAKKFSLPFFLLGLPFGGPHRFFPKITRRVVLKKKIRMV